ncbi:MULTISPECIES: hypothetical protein [Chryseobacterium]|uniref:Uncharacterized protein n=1 Tax=Chryseobacterium taihuense TaxID=1141221 RepID=A0A4U8WFD4_9FLAO|nr:MULTISPECIES: hypothetical protein [Chryseobacterium]QQV02659.1 hypothetical protein I6I61_16595 [Chryseobacterium sp. FDAARGOS 1104]VFB04080.1 Uncharacterised protein [Chryseobacterium taihuense]
MKYETTNILSIFFKAQNFELKDNNLIKYYKIINQAEKNIINNNLDSANQKYKQAFVIFREPHANDLSNSMKVALKVNDLETAYTNYQALKCLGKIFDSDFVTNNFKNIEKHKIATCKNTIDLQYKKTLDSLFTIDQYYRKLSNGNYQAYKKELTKGDSITSTNLLKLIQEKGFPNEYNIGLEMNSTAYFHDFYFIIWHQLASNLYSPQRVNFSNELIKALNAGKIRPDIAGKLLDLNNNTRDYSYFRIYQFGNGDGTMDCCYISKNLMPENRDDKVKHNVENVNEKRKKIGLSTTEEEVRKSIFLLNNKDYTFSENVLDGWIFKDPKDVEKFKIDMIKVNDTSY